MAKFLNLLLLLLLIGGMVRIFMQTSVLKRLTEEHRRLTAMHGELDVKDSSKFLVTGVDTGDPMHFKWRIYYPAGLKVEQRVGFGWQRTGGGWTQTTNDRETIHQVRFDFSHKGQLRTHVLLSDGGSLRGFGHGVVSSFLKEHWSDLEVNQLGDQGPVEVPTDRVMKLLTIRLPSSLQPAFEKHVGEKLALRYQNPVYGVIYGTPAAFKLFDKQNSEKPRE